MHCFRTPRLWTWGRLFVAPHLKPKTGGDIYPIRNSQAFQVSFQVVTVIWVGRLIMENVFPLPWQPVPPFTCPVYSWCIPNLFIIGIHKKVLKKNTSNKEGNKHNYHTTWNISHLYPQPQIPYHRHEFNMLILRYSVFTLRTSLLFIDSQRKAEFS